MHADGPKARAARKQAEAIVDGSLRSHELVPLGTQDALRRLVDTTTDVLCRGIGSAQATALSHARALLGDVGHEHTSTGPLDGLSMAELERIAANEGEDDDWRQACRDRAEMLREARTLVEGVEPARSRSIDRDTVRAVIAAAAMAKPCMFLKGFAADPQWGINDPLSPGDLNETLVSEVCERLEGVERTPTPLAEDVFERDAASARAIREAASSPPSPSGITDEMTEAAMRAHEAYLGEIASLQRAKSRELFGHGGGHISTIRAEPDEAMRHALAAALELQAGSSEGHTLVPPISGDTTICGDCLAIATERCVVEGHGFADLDELYKAYSSPHIPPEGHTLVPNEERQRTASLLRQGASGGKRALSPAQVEAMCAAADRLNPRPDGPWRP
jgi:hypothetical protein